MTLRKTLLSGAIAGTLLVLGLCARGGERVASSPEWGEGGNPIGRAFGLKERSGTASAGFTTECTEVHGRLGNVAARCLSSRIFRNTLSTPSAADSEFSPVITERALGSHLKPRGRKFAESDAFFGGAGSGWADKFRLLPQTSVSSVVKTQSGQNILS